MNSSKTKTIVIVILSIAGILGLIGAGIAYYFSTLDTSKDTDNTQKKYCACITSYTTSSCNACGCPQIESQGLDSSLGEVVNGQCNAQCYNEKGEAKKIESSTDAKYINCPVQDISSVTSCNSVSVRNTTTKELIIPPINPDGKILVSARFTPQDYNGTKEVFKKFTFTINGKEYVVPDDKVRTETTTQGTIYIPEIEFTEFGDANTLTVQAAATSDLNPQSITDGRFCYKQFQIAKADTQSCTSITLQATQQADKVSYKLDELRLKTPNVTSTDKLTIEFSFDDSRYDTFILNSVASDALVNNTIILEKDVLYPTDKTIYSNKLGFPTFSFKDGDKNTSYDIEISAQIYIDGQKIPSSLCNEVLTLVQDGGKDPYVPDPDTTPVCQNGCLETGEACDPTASPATASTNKCTADPNYTKCNQSCELSETSNFTVKLDGAACLAKTGNNTSVPYKITIYNKDKAYEDIEEIKGKLPIGFEYIANSTKINGDVVADKDFVTVANVGNAQEITWSTPDGWSVNTMDSLIVDYMVKVTSKAVDGKNQNEVVIKPVNTPVDANALRTEVVTELADKCTNKPTTPNTGLWDSSITKLVAGLIVVISGFIIYQGRIRFVNTVLVSTSESAPVKKIFSPKEYFEDKVLKSTRRKKS